MFHLSDIRKFERCEKLLYLKVHKPLPFSLFMACHENIVELGIRYFGLDVFFLGETGDSMDRVLSAWNDFDVFVNARFSYDELRVTIPFLFKKTDGTVKVVFASKQRYPKESEAQQYADSVWVLRQAGLRVDEAMILHLNEHYVRSKELDVFELLLLSDHLYNERNHAHGFLMQLIEEKQRDLNLVLQRMKAVVEGDYERCIRRPICTHRGKCDYFSECFGKDPVDSIFHLTQAKEKYELANKGIVSLSMIDGDMLELSRHQYAQVMAAKSDDGWFYDMGAIGNWLQQLSFPLSYLDFEWETYVYPPYERMKPYDVMCFQYSLHVEEKLNGELIHEQFIGEGDCRIAFIESLIEKIPKEGSIVVFNALGGEVLRLKQLAFQFPHYQEQLQAIWERMVDLSLLFSSGNIYHVSMAGGYSLKRLVKVFGDFDYHDLDVSDGMEAVEQWRLLGKEGVDRELILKQLYDYCGMDTLAMVIVLHRLFECQEKGSF